MADLPKDRQLSTWNEIANYLRVTVRTAQNWEEQMGLPVHRLPGKKPRVWAYPAELDAWRARTASAGGLPAVSETLTGGATSPQPFTDAGPGPTRRLVWFSAAVLLVAAVALWATHWRRGRTRAPAAIRVQAGTIITTDIEGREIWRYRFPMVLWDHPEYYRFRTSTFSDLDRDGSVETLFTYVPNTSPRMVHVLYCFGQDGRVKWRFEPNRPVLEERSGDKYFPPYFISNIQVLRDRRGVPRVAVSSNHHLQAPNQIAVLDSAGRLLGDYWHPGHLLHMMTGDLGNDGDEDLFLAGVNNGHHSATLVVFDPANVHGTAKGLSDERFELMGLPDGTERTVVLFPRTCVALAKPVPQPYNRVCDLRVTKERIFVTVTENIAELDLKRIIYELDSDFRVISAAPTLEYRTAHREMEQAGRLDHTFSPDEVEHLKRRVMVIKKR